MTVDGETEGHPGAGGVYVFGAYVFGTYVSGAYVFGAYVIGVFVSTPGVAQRPFAQMDG